MLEIEKIRKKDKITVLWVSNEHRPLPAQVEELRKLGEIEIVELIEFVPNAEYVMEKAREANADVIVPILPMSFVTRLVELARPEITVLWAKMRQIHRCRSVRCPEFNPSTDTVISGMERGKPVLRHFRFQKFEEILGLNFVTRDLFSHNCVLVVKIEFTAKKKDAELIATDISSAIQEVLKMHGLEGDVNFNF